MNTWTREFPTEPGYYWCYGWIYKQFENRDHPPVLRMFQRYHNSCEDHFYINDDLYVKRHFGTCLWLKIEMPELPMLVGVS